MGSKFCNCHSFSGLENLLWRDASEVQRKLLLAVVISKYGLTLYFNKTLGYETAFLIVSVPEMKI